MACNRHAHPPLIPTLFNTQTFRAIQLGFATAFVPFVAYFGAMAAEMSRVVCSRSGRRQFTVEGCPTWPLYMTLALLVASMVVTFINWAKSKFQHPGLWLTSIVVIILAIGMIMPSAMRGIKFQGIPSFYLRYLSLAVILVVVALWQGAGVKEPTVVLPKTTPTPIATTS